MSLPVPIQIDETTLVRSDLLGELHVQPDELVHFAQGLYGFPACRTFVLVETERQGAYWLQSLEHSALTFLVIDPFPYFADYDVDVPPAELQRLGVREPSDVAVLSIVTMPASPEAPFTANLQAPVVLNVRTRVALQCILPGERHGTTEPFSLADRQVAGTRGS
jgi:flagellar assembly factor FliW